MKIYYLLFVSFLLVGCASVPADTDVHELPLSSAKKLARAGNKEAVHDLCYRFIYGRGAQLDYQQAIKWCNQGAALGVDSSQTLLAEIYYFGHGTPIDYAQALSWYQAAAAQDHPHALLMLYYMYTDGKGVSPNKNLALSYLQQAADAGYQAAIDELAKQQPKGN
jgi:uncharacterized protein